MSKLKIITKINDRLKYINFIYKSHKYMLIFSKNRQLQFLFYIKTERVICLEESYPKNYTNGKIRVIY